MYIIYQNKKKPLLTKTEDVYQFLSGYIAFKQPRNPFDRISKQRDDLETMLGPPPIFHHFVDVILSSYKYIIRLCALLDFFINFYFERKISLQRFALKTRLTLIYTIFTRLSLSIFYCGRLQLNFILFIQLHSTFQIDKTSASKLLYATQIYVFLN